MKLFDMKGVLEVIAYKKNKKNQLEVIHYDRGENFITPWMQHSLIRLSSGRIFERYGNTRKYTLIGSEDTESPDSELIDRMTIQCPTSSSTNCSHHSQPQGYENFLWSKPHFHPGDALVEKIDWKMEVPNNYVWYWDETTETRTLKELTLTDSQTFANDGTSMSAEQICGITQTVPEFTIAPVPYRMRQYMEDNINLYNYVIEDYIQTKMIYPNFPTKMLFGIGPRVREEGGYSDDSKIWFDRVDNNPLPRDNGDSRSLDNVPDIYAHDHPCFIEGEIRVLTGNDSIEDDYWINLGNGIDFDYRLVKPAFVYFTRSIGYTIEDEIYPPLLIHNDEYNLESKTSIGLGGEGYSPDGNFSVENLGDKITFKCVLPMTEEDWQCPYNGYTLKVAGLYNDSKFLINDENVENDIYENFITSTNKTENEREEFYLKNPYSMIFGQLLAKKYISPITKTKDVGIEFRWSLYYGPVETEGGNPWISPVI